MSPSRIGITSVGPSWSCCWNFTRWPQSHHSVSSKQSQRSPSPYETQPNIAAECRNPNNRQHLKKAGADEVISPNELGLRLLARTALFHGMTRVYQELLTVGRDANEMYLLPAPEGLVGKDFVELTGMFARHRGDRRSCLLIGIQRGDEMHLNPIGGEAGPLRADDQLIAQLEFLLERLQTPPPERPDEP